MKTNNKTRANRWEREASRLLSLWISGGKRKDIFWRTNSSGAKGTVTKERNHCGDIVASDPAGADFSGRFHIEAKWRKEFDYSDLGTLRKWIGKEGKTAKELGKNLLMLIKGRNGEVYVMVDAGNRARLSELGVPVPVDERLVYQGYTVSRVLYQDNRRQLIST